MEREPRQKLPIKLEILEIRTLECPRGCGYVAVGIANTGWLAKILADAHMWVHIHICPNKPAKP